jgi:hypothetical protein
VRSAKKAAAFPRQIGPTPGAHLFASDRSTAHPQAFTKLTAEVSNVRKRDGSLDEKHYSALPKGSHHSQYVNNSIY